MPVVAIVQGMKIEFYPSDHAPPHFHIDYNEYKASIDITTCLLTKGSLPKRKYHAIIEWSKDNQSALLEAWNAMRLGQLPRKI